MTHTEIIDAVQAHLDVHQTVTPETIATTTGATLPAVNRAFDALEARGLIGDEA